MKLLQNILVPTDFGNSASGAVNMAIRLAGEFGSCITLLHVLQDNQMSNDLESMVMNSIREKLSEIKSRISREQVAVSESLIEKGLPFEQIIRVARNISANVILVGEGNHSPEEKYRLGTTVEKLLRKNQVPLWVIRQQSDTCIRRILCPVDLSEPSRRALANAIILAEHFDAGLTILNVFSPIRVVSPRLKVDEELENERLRNKQSNDFNSFLGQFDTGSLRVEKILADGEPFTKILDTIREKEIDLLLMGTTGRTGLSRILMGSVTEKVTREVPCNFITTKARDLMVDFFEENLKEIDDIIKLGRRAMEEGLPDRAIDIYTAGIRQFPDNIPILTGLIVSYKATGDTARAEQYRNYARTIILRMWGEEYLERINLG